MDDQRLRISVIYLGCVYEAVYVLLLGKETGLSLLVSVGGMLLLDLLVDGLLLITRTIEYDNRSSSNTSTVPGTPPTSDESLDRFPDSTPDGYEHAANDAETNPWDPCAENSFSGIMMPISRRICTKDED